MASLTPVVTAQAGAKASNTLAAAYLAQGISSLGSAYSEAEGIRTQGDIQSAAMESNARLAGAAAKDAIDRGEKDVSKIRRAGRRLAGSQKANYTGQGVDIHSGSPSQVVGETLDLSEEDAMTARNNAWREAWGFRAQAEDYRSQGKMRSNAAEGAARRTLLTGGLEFLRSGAFAAYAKGK